MEHDRFSKRENMSEVYYRHHVSAYIEMLQRKYPKYDGNQYVLWIVPELIYRYHSQEIIGSVSIIKKDGTEVNVDQILRTPYPNKAIHQISTKVGRKRVYGVPLIFDTFEELCEVSDIHIQFDIYSSIYMDEMPFVPFMNHLDIWYHVNFILNKEHPEYKIFTIFSKDNIDYEEEEYMNQYDFMVEIEGTIDEDEKVTSYDQKIDGYSLINIYTMSVYRGKLDDDRISVLEDNFSSMNLPCPEKMRQIKKITRVKDEFNFEKHYFERTETLIAEELPDILTLSCFGFKNE